MKDTPVTMGHNAVKQQQPYKKEEKQVEEVQSTKQASKEVANQDKVIRKANEASMKALKGSAKVPTLKT